jgi:hypothetical protein
VAPAAEEDGDKEGGAASAVLECSAKLSEDAREASAVAFSLFDDEDRFPLLAGASGERADDDRRSEVPGLAVVDSDEEEDVRSGFFLPPPPRMGLMIRAPPLFPFPIDDERPRLCARAWAALKETSRDECKSWPQRQTRASSTRRKGSREVGDLGPALL